MTDYPRLWQRRLSPLLDPALAAAVFVVSVLALTFGYKDTDTHVPGWAFALVVAQCVPLVFRRRWPIPVAFGCGTLTVVYGVASLPDPAVPYAALVAVYTVTARTDRRWAYVAAIVSAISVTTAMVFDWANVDAEDVTVNYLVFAVAWLLGDGARRRRDRTDALEQRAAVLERTRAAEARTAVIAERNRIARDLHDVVAHHLSMMVVQAEAGPVAIAGHPDKAEQAFAAISTAGKEALVEMRRVLGVLKSDEAAPLAPRAGVEAVPDLADRVRGAGVDVRLDVTGDTVALPVVVDMSAYRLVQEALTNAMRHGHARRVDVEIAYTAEDLRIDVTDDGVGGEPNPAAAGHGLVAMRERVSLVGGSLNVGPRPEGGWAVRARLPLETSEAR